MEFGLLLWKYPGKLDYSLKIHEQIGAPRAQPGNIHKPYTYRSPGLTASGVGAEL